jgi:hypothetical protein
MQPIRKLTIFLEAIADSIMAQTKTTQAECLSDLKQCLIYAKQTPDHSSLLENFIQKYTWLDSLPTAQKEHILKAALNLLSEENALAELTQFELIWDSLYMQKIARQPDCLVTYQESAADAFLIKKTLLEARFKQPTADGTVPTDSNHHFYLSSLPLVAHKNQSNYETVHHTDTDRVFILPGGVQAYLNLGWVPPEDYVAAHMEDRITHTTSNTFCGMGGYMSTNTITAAQQAQVFENTALNHGDGQYFNETNNRHESQRHYGFLFGLLDEKTKEPFAVVDGAQGEFYVKHGLMHPAVLRCPKEANMNHPFSLAYQTSAP